MCDYSLHSVRTRPAKVGEELITYNFGTGTRGFAAPEDCSVAVCLLPGTELAFDAPIKYQITLMFGANTGHTVAIFRQINKGAPHIHHDALEFPDGWLNQHDILEDSTMTIRLLMAGVVAGLIVSSSTFAQDKASQKFLKEAIEGNLAEVQVGELAQKNGGSDRVRSFGQMLQKDHLDANQKAKSAANQLGMSPPSEPNSKQKAMYDRMSKLSGANFDREFAKNMVEDHKKAIKEYEKEAKKNDAGGAYAKEALPTLHKHLETAQSLSGAATTGKR